MSPGDDPDAELRRVVDRLRTMPLTRLGAHAQGARMLAQELADRCAALTGDTQRVVPDVGEAAVGDQVAVTGQDLIEILCDPADLAWMSRRLREFRLSL